MGFLSAIGLTRESATDAVERRAAAAEANVEILREGMADLELALEDRGWDLLLDKAADEFSRPGLTRIAALARAMSLQHPLIKRGLTLRQSYVWGQGVDISARAAGDRDDAEQDVNAVVQDFLDAADTKRVLSGHQAHERLERALGTDGNVFLALYTAPLTGKVQPRTIPFDEVTEILSAPGDRATPWYYRRTWIERTVDPTTGAISTTQRTEWHPAVGYRPAPGGKLKTIAGAVVRWDAPVHHTKVNDLDGWQFGVGDAYAALSFARGYKDFLQDWLRLVKALSQFAFRVTTKGSKAQKARQALGRRTAEPAPADNPNTVGATAILTDDDKLEAIPKTGATVDSESGRPAAAMIAAAFGVPVTMLLADPGITGARASAETLDTPTELEMGGRRAVWSETLTAILTYVITEAVRAPQGPLKGTIVRDPLTDTETVELAGDTDMTVEIVWPNLTDIPLAALVQAIVNADSTKKIPPEQIARLLLQALGVKDIDELIESMRDDQGRWIGPEGVASAIGNAAVDAFNRGEDPAQLVGSGLPQDDGEDTGA